MFTCIRQKKRLRRAKRAKDVGPPRLESAVANHSNYNRAFSNRIDIGNRLADFKEYSVHRKHSYITIDHDSETESDDDLR